MRESDVKKALIWSAAVAALVAGGGYGLWRAGASGLDAALDAEIASLAAQGVTLSHGARTLSGFPFAYVLRLEDVRAEATGDGWRAAVPWTRTEAGLLGGVARTTIASRATVEITPPPEAALGDAPLAFTVTSQDLAVETPLTGPDRASVTAAALAMEHPGGAALGATAVSAQGLSVTLERFATGAAKVEGAIARLVTALDAAPGDGAGRAESVTDDVVFSAQGRGLRGLDLPAFLRGDGEAEIWISAGALATTGPDGAQGGSGPTSSRLRVGAGRLFYTGETADARYAVALPQTLAPPQTGAQPLTVTAARTAIALEAPLAPAAAAQAYLLDLTLDEVAAPEALWAAFDPQALLPRDPLSLKARVGGAARVLVDLAAAAETPGAPVAVETVEITGFRFDGLGASASGDAALKIVPGAPTPDGRVFVTVEGWRPVLDAAVRLGVATPDLAIFLTSIAEQLNSPDAEDGVFTSQIELRDGAVFANGTRVN